jgi:hypothetical protein
MNRQPPLAQKAFLASTITLLLTDVTDPYWDNCVFPMLLDLQSQVLRGLVDHWCIAATHSFFA